MENRFAERGFITMMGMGFLGVILTLVFGLSSFGFVLKKRMLLSSHCNQTVMKLQKNLSGSLTDLLKLNPRVQALNLQMKMAQQRLKLALSVGHPAAIAAARAHVLIIKGRQSLIKGKQDLLLLQAKIEREQFKSLHYPNVKRKTRFLTESSGLAVSKVSPEEFLTEYRPSDDFFEEQGQSYSVSKTYLPPLLSRANDFKSIFTLSTKCSSTLKNTGGNRWIPVLKEVKVYWRWSYGSSFSAV